MIVSPRADDMVAILFPHLYDGITEDEIPENVIMEISEELGRVIQVNATDERRMSEDQPIASTSRTMISTVA